MCLESLVVILNGRLSPKALEGLPEVVLKVNVAPVSAPVNTIAEPDKALKFFFWVLIVVLVKTSGSKEITIYPVPEVAL